MEEQTKGKSAYGKRPIWQWVLLYVVIGGIVYGAIYFTFFHKQDPYSNTHVHSATQIQQVQNGVYKIMVKGKLGMVMTDTRDMTLYTFANDTTGISKCTGSCLQLWPAYMAPSATGKFPANINVMKRSNGTLQYTWKGMPLYYYSKDSDTSDAYGNGIGGLWSVIKL